MKVLLLFFISLFFSPSVQSTPCDLNHYPVLCQNELVSCYECYNHFNQSQACIPVFENTSSPIRNYPRSDWNCTVHDSSQNEHHEKVYYACSGDICLNEEWDNHFKHKGKYWCGKGSCFKTHNRVVCTKPQYCERDL